MFHQNAPDRVHFVLPSRPRSDRDLEPSELGAAALSEYNAGFVVLAEGRRGEIRRLADTASDPTAAGYGRHVTREELGKLVALPDEELAGIHSWASRCGVRIVARERQFVRLEVPSDRLEEAFGYDVRGWLEKDPDHRGARMATGLPRRIAGAVLKIGGLPGARQQGDAWSGQAPVEPLSDRVARRTRRRGSECRTILAWLGLRRSWPGSRLPRSQTSTDSPNDGTVAARRSRS